MSALCCGKWAEGWGEEWGIYQVASREGTAGAPQLGLAKSPSSQVSAFVANTPFVFMPVDGSIAPEAKILHHSTSMSKSCKATHHSVAPRGSGSWSSTASWSCPQPTLITNTITCLNRLRFSCNLATRLHRKSLSLKTLSKQTFASNSL